MAMRRIKYEPVSQIKHTFLNLVERWPLMLFVILMDVTFLFFFGLIYKLYFDNIISHATNIMQQSSTMTSALQSQDIYSAAPAAQFMSLELFQIKKLAILLAISIFAIWVVFQAFNWWNAFRISGRKISYLSYLKTFTSASAIWALLVSLTLYVSISVYFANAMAISGGAEPEGIILDIGMIVAFAVIGYFALVSYSLSGSLKDVFKKTVVFSFLKSRVFVAYIFVSAMLLIINFIVFGLWRILLGISDMPALIIGIIFVLLFFVYARVYMINVVQELDKKKN